jgi:hypothetical protein
MSNLKQSKRLYDTVYILYFINFVLNVLAFVIYFIIWGVNRGSYLDLILVFLGVSFYILCWWLAKNAAYSIYKNSKRLVELEELLAQHNIEFPKAPEPQCVTPVVEGVADVATVNSEDTIINPGNEEDKGVADAAATHNEADDFELKNEESEEEAPNEEELVSIDELIDEATKREVVVLLSAGREMKALLLMVNAGIQMDVAARYIDNLKSK